MTVLERSKHVQSTQLPFRGVRDGDGDRSGGEHIDPSRKNARGKRLAGLPGIDEAAEMAGVSRRTIQRGLAGKCGTLRHLRIGNRVGIHPDDLAVWLKSFAVVPKIAAIPSDLNGWFPELEVTSETPKLNSNQPFTMGHND